MIRAPRQPLFGAVPTAEGYRFRLWAPEAASVTLHLRRREEAGSDLFFLCATRIEKRDLTPHPLPHWETVIPGARVGDLYAYSVDDGPALADPAGRFLPDGVHLWSEIVDPRAFTWTDGSWLGLDATRAVIYELHVGTFTPEGTFRAALGKLPYLRDLGITAIELMPVADFAGRRNWGYDGVALFAPSRAYGRPDDLRAFVNAAHQLGLAVILDVVYNHFGPEGQTLSKFSPQFFTRAHSTPWGVAVNLDEAGSDVVRAFLKDNALHWIDEYHLDGLRLDATHSLFDSGERHFVAELAEAVHRAADPAPLVYAEDYRNRADMLLPASSGGWDLEGTWADDFHHIVRRMLAGDRHGYYADYHGTADELATTLRDGWLYSGQHSTHERSARGTDPRQVPMRKSVICIQNHDQVGNRALGDRLHDAADPAAWRAAVAVLLTAPMTPLLFMGQEWATSAPFQFFTDFEPGLGELVRDGRRREFRDFPEFATEEAARLIPDPQAETTFEASRLRWEEMTGLDHARALALHRALLKLRADRECLQGSDACTSAAQALDTDTVTFTRGQDPDGVVVVARLRGAGRVTVTGLDETRSILLDTEDPAFAADPRPPAVDRSAGAIDFARPGAILLAGPA
jgi:maltooligosyltrehalose trehalohydrolase